MVSFSIRFFVLKSASPLFKVAKSKVLGVTQFTVPVIKMHQTKIGQFFVKQGSNPAASPVKKAEGKRMKPLKISDSEEDDDDNNTNKKVIEEKETKTPKKDDKTKSKSNGSSKRKSKISSDEEDEPELKPEVKSAKKRSKAVPKSDTSDDEDNKKPTKNSTKVTKSKSKKISSDEESEPEPEVKEEKPKAKREKKTDSKSSKPVKSDTNEKKTSKNVDKKEDNESETNGRKRKSKNLSEDEDEPKMSTDNKSNKKPRQALVDYNPAKPKYHPIDDAVWQRGEKVPYLALAKTLEAIEGTSSRLKFIEILANYFRSVILLTPEDLLFSVYLCLNKLAPAYEGVELGVAETNVMKAIAQATGRSFDKIKAEAGTMGDLGLVAETSRSNQKTLFQPQPLNVSGVFHKLKEIAAMHGTASHAKKISMITSMLVACKFSEARYLTRSLLGKLRIGLAEQSLLQALAQSTFLTPPNQDMSEWPPKILDAGSKMSPDKLKTKMEEHAFIIKSSYCECPNYDKLVKALIEVGIDGVKDACKLTPGVPPRPMLAQPTKGVADVLERFDGIRFTCEYKYDGERAQVHLLEDGTLNVYSRNQENNTSKYPDIISRFSQCIKGDVKSCILDSEAVAWDLEKKTILPFQVLSTRKRKDANEAEIKVQVCIFAFDLIYLNGKSLIKEPLIKRRELLKEHFQEVTGQFLFATSLDTDSMEEVQEFLEESIKGNCEGLMVKTLDERASYELAKRSQKWLKLKKDYLDSGGDSLDLVVIGGFLGKGKRTGTYGGFLLACYDADEEVYQTICKLGTGFSDDDLLKHTESLKPHIIPSAKSYYRYNQQLAPDHWIDAVQVWEVKCADLSLSPVHTAAEGIADSQRGISLRFPRFLRIREDKNIEDATSSQQVADMYKSQEVVKNASANKKKDDEDEFY